MSIELLREAISAILTETKAQPLPAKLVVAKLKQQLLNYVTSPENWDAVVRRQLHNFSDPKVADSLTRDELTYALDRDIRIVANAALIEINFSKTRYAFNELLIDWMNEHSDEFFKRRGWFTLIGKQSDVYDHDGNEVLPKKWTFSSNYSQRIVDVPKIVYHTTPSENVDRILRRGLFPRHGASKASHPERKTPPRVYVTSSKEEALELSLAFGFGADAYTSERSSDGHTVLQIDTSKLEKGTKFYVDPEMSNLDGNSSMWTYSRIPASAISIEPDSVEDFEQFKLGRDAAEQYR